MTLAGERVVGEFEADADAAVRRDLRAFVRSLADGTWRTRWLYQQYSSGPDVFMVRVGPRLSVFMTVVHDVEVLGVAADIFSIVANG